MRKASGYLDGGLQHAAGVVAQVQDQALETALVVLAQLVQRLDHFLAGVDLELGDAQVGVAGFEDLALDTLDLDDGALEFDVERSAAIADDGQGDRGAGLAAHAVDRFGHRLALGRLAVDLHDQVAGLDAGAGRGGVVDRRDHLDEAVFAADLDAQAAELAAGAFLQLGEVLRAEVGGVRVEVAEHALDGVLQQGLVVHWLDIGGLHPVENLGEGTQLVEGQRGTATVGQWRGVGRGVGSLGRARAEQQGQRQGGGTEAMQHVQLLITSSAPIPVRGTR